MAVVGNPLAVVTMPDEAGLMLVRESLITFAV